MLFNSVELNIASLILSYFSTFFKISFNNNPSTSKTLAVSLKADLAKKVPKSGGNNPESMLLDSKKKLIDMQNLD